MSEITKEAYDAAVGVVRDYIRQEITKTAVAIWNDPDDYTREEFEGDGETFEDFLKVHTENAMEDECPGGVSIESDVFGTFIDND